MNTNRPKSFEDFKALLADIKEGPECTNPGCPNARRVHILAESITINNLIVGGELSAEMKQAIASRLAA